MAIKLKVKNKKIARKKQVRQWVTSIEKELNEFYQKDIHPKLEKVWSDCLVFGYGKEEIILPSGAKQVIELKYPERYYTKSCYKSPASMLDLPDLKEIEKLIKDLS